MKKRTYLISLSLAAGLALSQLTGCASSGPEETTAAESTQAPSEAETASIPNPMEEVENEQSFESMGIHMVAPADGENTKFYTISGKWRRSHLMKTAFPTVTALPIQRKILQVFLSGLQTRNWL